jgi:hypothetical protein
MLNLGPREVSSPGIHRWPILTALTLRKVSELALRQPEGLIGAVILWDTSKPT